MPGRTAHCRGGGEQARTVAARAGGGREPPEACRSGFTIRDYADEGLLGDLSSVRQQGGLGQRWFGPAGQVLEERQGPVGGRAGEHPPDQLIWANKKIFDELKTLPPKTFDELLASPPKIKAADAPARARGQPWQEATIFDARDVGRRAGFYKKAMIELDSAALEQARTWRRPSIRWPSSGPCGRQTSPAADWNLATAMVINGRPRCR